MRIKPKKLLINKETLEPIRAKRIFSEAKIENAILSNLDYTELKAKNASFEESVIERSHFVAAKLEKLSFMDVEAKASDFSAALCSDSSLVRVHFIGCRMIGVDFNRSVIKDVIFKDCKLDMANFRFAKLTRVRFMKCTFIDADFQAAEIREVAFDNCHLEKVEFGQCKIKQVDVRGSQLYDIKGWQSLRGLIINSTQLVTIAPQLAAELGLIIEE